MREGGVELTRRWVATLVLVAPEDRERLVEEVESRVAALYELPRSGIAPQPAPVPMQTGHTAVEPKPDRQPKPAKKKTAAKKSAKKTTKPRSTKPSPKR